MLIRKLNGAMLRKLEISLQRKVINYVGNINPKHICEGKDIGKRASFLIGTNIEVFQEPFFLILCIYLLL